MKTAFILTLTTILKMMSSVNSSQTPSKTYFIAMEYKGISNCILKIYVTDSLIMGAKVNGYIVSQPYLGIGTTVPIKRMHDPEAYVKMKLDTYDSLLTDQSVFLKRDKYNFIVRRSAIKRIWHDPSHKWGMGYYPDTGKIYLESDVTPENKKGVRELILVGDQNVNEILEMLNK